MLISPVRKEDENSATYLPAVLFVAGMGSGGPLVAQSAGMVAPKFDVASIKRSTGCVADAGRGRGGVARSTPGRFYRSCATLLEFIQTAYNLGPSGARRGDWPASATGGPDWVKSELFTIEAKADGTPDIGIMNGPMMQSLLEDRFKLKIRRESRGIPVYTLTVAKGGSKLQAFKEGSCKPWDFLHYAPPPDPSLNPCMPQRTFKGQNEVFDVKGMTISDFCRLEPLSRLDRRVIDKTGLTGMFNFNLEIASDEPVEEGRGGRGGEEHANDLAGPSIFTALEQQLGLKLTATKGPGEFLVIVSATRPSEN